MYLQGWRQIVHPFSERTFNFVWLILHMNKMPAPHFPQHPTTLQKALNLTFSGHRNSKESIIGRLSLLNFWGNLGCVCLWKQRISFRNPCSAKKCLKALPSLGNIDLIASGLSATYVEILNTTLSHKGCKQLTALESASFSNQPTPAGKKQTSGSGN